MKRNKISRRHFIETAAIGLASSYATNAVADDRTAAPQKAAGRFQDKVVLITGATSGIGKACAEAFAREGARVHFCGRREGEGMKLVQQMTQQRLIMSFSKADVKNENEVKAFAANCVAKYGQIDIAINNAGIYPQADFVAAPTSVHLDTLETNVNGVFFSMKYEIEQMLKQKDGGTIVNMASTSSHKAATFASASYCASKHAVLGLTKTAALMYAGKKIRVNAVSPAQVEPQREAAVGSKQTQSTRSSPIERVPAGRLCTVEEIVNSVLWLASPESSYTHGHSLILDGGRLA